MVREFKRLLLLKGDVRGGSLRGSSPLKNLSAGENPLHLWTHDFE